MNPEHKLLLDESKRFSDELTKRFNENDLAWTKRLSDRDSVWEQQLSDLQTTQDVRLSALEKDVGATESWLSEIEGTMDDIKLEMKKLNNHFARSPLENPTAAPGFCCQTLYLVALLLHVLAIEVGSWFQ